MSTLFLSEFTDMFNWHYGEDKITSRALHKYPPRNIWVLNNDLFLLV